jgi:hypothetical protein
VPCIAACRQINDVVDVSCHAACLRELQVRTGTSASTREGR